MHWVVVSAVASGVASGATTASAQAATSGPSAVNSSASLSAGTADDLGTKSGDGAPEPRGTDEHAAGTYAGVVPGGAQPASITVPAGQTPAQITWPGFQMRPDGTSRVFFQSTVPVPVQTSLSASKFVMKLPGTQIAGDNNRLPLETRFFNTPVTRVTITHARDGVTVTLDLRAPVTPQVSGERCTSGYAFTYIDLPAGSFLGEAEKQVLVATPTKVAAAPVPANPNAGSELPAFLDDAPGSSASGRGSASGKASANVKVDTSMDHELPPGIKATKPTAGAQTQTKAQAGIKLGN
jgi:hypothetical protein